MTSPHRSVSHTKGSCETGPGKMDRRERWPAITCARTARVAVVFVLHQHHHRQSNNSTIPLTATGPQQRTSTQTPPTPPPIMILTLPTAAGALPHPLSAPPRPSRSSWLWPCSRWPCRFGSSPARTPAAWPLGPDPKYRVSHVTVRFGC